VSAFVLRRFNGRLLTPRSRSQAFVCFRAMQSNQLAAVVFFKLPVGFGAFQTAELLFLSLHTLLMPNDEARVKLAIWGKPGEVSGQRARVAGFSGVQEGSAVKDMALQRLV
jgi:hypothetical protein